MRAGHERSQDAVPAQVAPWGEIRRNAPRTDSKPRNNAISVGVRNISNPVYAEAAPCELGYILQGSLGVQTAWYVDDDGRLDMTRLPTAFRTFFGEHSEHWPGRFSEYPEAGPPSLPRGRTSARAACRGLPSG